ncbi:hypothetical protein ACS0TY_023993 [Phlomoides rotata]
MRTRRGICYTTVENKKQRKVEVAAGEKIECQTKVKVLARIDARGCDLFDALPDDLVLSILSKLISTARCPVYFINVLIRYGSIGPPTSFY